MIGVGTFKVSQNGRTYVNEVLSSGRLSYGPFTQKFERLFAASHDCRFGIMTASGTCALMIALAALKNRHGWQDGDEVIVPAVTFIATSNIVLQLGLKPVFVDVDPFYYELDPEKIEAAITSKTRCIIPVHLFGHPCDMGAIQTIAQKHSLRMIEDSCESMFTRLDGKSVGAFGDIGCFSTYVAHILTTGVGGLCTTNDPDLSVQLRSLMNHGRDSIYLSIDDDDNKSKVERELIIQRRFSFVQMGYSFRVTEMEGALGLSQLEEQEVMMAKRLENGNFFLRELSRFSDRMQLPKIRPGAGHAFMMFPLVLRKEKKEELVRYLEENGIETRDMLPLINQPYYKKIFNIDEQDFPVAKWINESGFYIGCHQDLTDLERDYMVDVFDGFFSKRVLKKTRNCLIVMSKGVGFSAEILLPSLPLTSFSDLILIEASGDERIPQLYKRSGFRVLQASEGKGSLLKQAINMTECENIVTFGLDGSNDPGDIDNLLIKLNRGDDLVIASRFLTEGGRDARRPFSYRSIGNRFFTFLLSVTFNRNVTDCNNIFRAFKKSYFNQLSHLGSGDGIMFELTLWALRKRARLSECPTVEMPMPNAKGKRNRIFSAIHFFGIFLAHLFSKKEPELVAADQRAPNKIN